MIPKQYFAASDRGLVRRDNEDTYLLHMPEDEGLIRRKGILAIVADGVGGGPGGKQASSMAVEMVKDSYYRFRGEDNLAALREALLIANLEIFKASQQDPFLRGMGTTCTALAIREGEAFLSHVGDSRAYLFRKKAFQQLSEDHTLVNKLITEGIISREEGRNHPRRNIILKALGTALNIDPDTSRIALNKDDILLLCSDGLHGFASDDEISSTLLRYPVRDAGHRLIELALEKSGADNITVVILRV